ncbi:MAG: hypothetical protein IKV61_01690 [Clostridia bacterium]|nr:hypothetical protein [Clostridia bacterium]
MFNNRQSDIIEKCTYQDEFVAYDYNSTTETSSVSSEAHAFNSRIPDNFDRILHYDLYSAGQDVRDRNETYTKYSNSVNIDANPSSTTMQFRGVNREEIYKDLRQEAVYEQTTRVSARGKLMLFAITAVIILLSVLVVFNTALLNNMNKLIEEKSVQIQTLNEQKEFLNAELEDIMNIENALN